MTDATSGAASAALSGETTQTQQTTGANSAVATTTTTTTAADQWFSKAAPEHIGVLEKKGWNTPDGIDKLISGYADVERAYRSGDKLMMPKDDTDVDAWSALHKRLGRPDTPDQYKFAEGVDKDTAKAFADSAHKLGFNQKQLDTLVKFDQERSNKAHEAFLLSAKQDSDAAMHKLNGEWGSKTPEQIEHNRRAMRAMGVSVKDFETAAAAMGAGGAEKLMRIFNAAGKSMREGSEAFNLKDESSLGFGMTTNRAKAEIAEKKADGEFMKRLYSGDKAAGAAWERLQKQAAGQT